MRRQAFTVLVLLLLFARAAVPQGDPLGPEFRVNTFITGDEIASSVARDPSGNFVVVWNSPQDGSSDGVFGQRYNGSGVPLGSEFRVNTYTTGFQEFPSVAADSTGNFVAVWHSNQEGSVGIVGQRFASSGAPLGSEFRVNTYTTGNQYFPSVAADSAGNFVVVWTSYGQDGSGLGIFAQRYGPIVPVELMHVSVE